jgi:hypothetical protein
MKRIVVTGLLFCSALLTAGRYPADCGIRFEALSTTAEAALARTKREFGELARSIDVRPSPHALEGFDGRLICEVESPSGERRVAGSLDYLVIDDRISINVDVNENDRGAGINRLMLLEVLKRNPHVRHIESHLGDTNAAAFLVNLATPLKEGEDRPLSKKFEESPVYKKQVFDQLTEDLKRVKSGSSALKFRQRLLDAYARTPDNRTNKLAGMNKIRTILFAPNSVDDIDIYAHSELGPDPDYGQTRTVIKVGKNRWAEILPSGELIRTTSNPLESP